MHSSKAQTGGNKCDHGGWHEDFEVGEFAFYHNLTVCPLCDDIVKKKGTTSPPPLPPHLDGDDYE
ncbi:MAG: hypothetical protein V3V74_07370 [Nitrosomonadaceae bacterium]